MPAESILFADVKCYYCGHISGQIVGQKSKPIHVNNFVPRFGYAGAVPRAGERLRCERCGGPVFLEDAPPGAATKAALAKAFANHRVADKAETKAA